jgi:pyruvate dehydrogenase (quinone)
LEKAAEILNSGDRVAILAGRGALGATDELLSVADILGAPIAKALLGKASVPDDNPYTTGPVGLLGSKPSQQALESCNRLLIVASLLKGQPNRKEIALTALSNKVRELL